jgi:hypothetical protein
MLTASTDFKYSASLRCGGSRRDEKGKGQNLLA